MEIWVAVTLLLGLGFCLKLLEFIFPSGGLFVVVAVVTWIAAIFLAFQHKLVFGLGVLAVVVLGAPLVFMVVARFWMRTSYAKRILLVAPGADEVLPEDKSRRQLKSLMGRVGRATCKMLPSGVIEIDGRNYEATSVGVAIEQGQSVRVVKVEANRLIVQPEAEHEIREAAENPLDRPIDSIIDDPFGEPLV